MLNLDRLDPDWNFAENHRKASRAGKVVAFNQRTEHMLICRCCLEPIEKEPIPIRENSKQLGFLGLGFPLFYQFLKSCILLLFLTIASYNALSLREAIQDNRSFCSNNDPSLPETHRILAEETLKCNTLFVWLAKIEKSVTYNEETMRIISFIVHLVGLMYVRNRLMKLQKYYNERTPAFYNFSILITGLSEIKEIQNKLRQFFREQFEDTHQIRHITLLPQYAEIREINKQKKKVTDTLRPFYDKKQEEMTKEEMEQMVSLKEKLCSLEDKIYQIALESNQLFKKDELICEKVICIFDHHHEQQTILKQFPNISAEIKKKYFGEHYKDVKMEQAPDPNEIMWENINMPTRQRVFRIIASYALSILTLVGIFTVIFFILTQKSLHLAHAVQNFHLHQDDYYLLLQYRGAIALVYVAMFLIVIFNKTVLSILFHKFTHFERHTTTSLEQFSFGLKLSFGFFFTTAIMTLAVEAIRFQNYYNHLYGVIDQQSIMFFMNSFFIPLFWLVNPLRLYKNLKRRWNYKKRSLTQLEANHLMEQFHYDMGKRFAEVIETMWFTFLYSTLIPVGALITIVGLIIYYWVDKYNLLRRSSITRQVSGKVIEASLMLLDLSLFFKPLGSLIFDLHLRNQFLPSTAVLLSVGFVYALFPKAKIIQYLSNQRFRKHTLSFQDLKSHFPNTYNAQHPVIRIIHYNKIKQSFEKSNYFIDDSTNENGTMLKPTPRFFRKLRGRKRKQSINLKEGASQSAQNFYGSTCTRYQTEFI